MRRLAGVLAVCAGIITVEDLQKAEHLHVLHVLCFHVVQSFQDSAVTSADDRTASGNVALGSLTFPLTCSHLLVGIQDLF